MKELWWYKLDSESYTPKWGGVVVLQGTLGVHLGAQRAGKTIFETTRPLTHIEAYRGGVGLPQIETNGQAFFSS